MTPLTADKMPEEIWAYETSGRNCQHYKTHEFQSTSHYQNVTKYIRADLVEKMKEGK